MATCSLPRDCAIRRRTGRHGWEVDVEREADGAGVENLPLVDRLASAAVLFLGAGLLLAGRRTAA